MKKPDLHIVSFSGGKDSTAMLLHMMELGMQIDIVLYCDTWMEFPAMYRHVEKVKKIVEDAGIKFVTLKSLLMKAALMTLLLLFTTQLMHRLLTGQMTCLHPLQVLLEQL